MSGRKRTTATKFEKLEPSSSEPLDGSANIQAGPDDWNNILGQRQPVPPYGLFTVLEPRFIPDIRSIKLDLSSLHNMRVEDLKFAISRKGATVPSSTTKDQLISYILSHPEIFSS